MNTGFLCERGPSWAYFGPTYRDGFRTFSNLLAEAVCVVTRTAGTRALAPSVLMACLQKGIIVFMARQKTTIYLEPDLLRATKTLAASSGRRDYEVIEAALRAYMRSEEAAAGRRQLQEMLDRWGQAGDGLAESDALELASREVREVRRERRARG